MSENDKPTKAPTRPARRQRGWLLWAGIAAGVLVLLVCVLVGMTWANGSRAKAELAEQYPPPGQMVDVGGYRLHINCQGEGSPTAVIEAAGGDSSVSWDQVRQEVAKFTRVCTYDRAGLGWSERSPKPRTAPNVVEELHALLTNAGIEGPYVLVGHSIGGLYVRLYAHEYPDELVGMVLVDASHEEQLLRYPEAYRQAVVENLQQFVSACRLPKLLNSIGLLAMSPENYPDEYLPPLPEATKEVLKGVILSDTRYFETVAEEYTSIEESLAQVRAAQIGSLGDIPLVVLTRGLSTDPDLLGLSDEEAQQGEAVWDELQAELAALSSNGKQVIAEESGHQVQLDQPELVIDAISDVVEAVGR
jgi:pimeloyl-ACP methyl ester carboxylesterase